MICITFDTDHLDDARMEEFLADLDLPGRATFFCTQRYASLEKTGHELNPHPTLVGGDDWERALHHMRDLFPDAAGWRSHSCVFSHLVAEWLSGNGYTYASTNDQFLQTGIEPVKHPWGIWHMPIFYMDNMDFSAGQFWTETSHQPFQHSAIETAISGEGLFVFDFHPIHLMLNTPNRDFYFAKRDDFKSGVQLGQIKYEGYGARNFYQELCETLTNRAMASVSLLDALHERVDDPAR